MFNAARRGPASISKVFRPSSTALRIPSSRPTALALLLEKSKPVQGLRFLHATSQLSRFEERSRGRGFQESGSTEHARPSSENATPPAEGPEINKFEELIQHNLVHPNVVNQIIGPMGLHTMTEVQTKTIKEGLSGVDM